MISGRIHAVADRSALIIGTLGLTALMTAASVGAGNAPLLRTPAVDSADADADEPWVVHVDEVDDYPEGGAEALALMGSSMSDLDRAIKRAHELAESWDTETPDDEVTATIFVIAAYSVRQPEIQQAPTDD